MPIRLRRRLSPQSETRPMMSDPGVARRPSISLAMLLLAKPNHHQKVLKLYIPPIFLLLPTFVERFLVSSWVCKWVPFLYFIIPRWKVRNLVLLGNYIYRFDHDDADEPKGAPIPVDSISSRLINLSVVSEYNYGEIDLDVDVIKRSLPIGYYGCFVVESAGEKSRYFATPTDSDAVVWVNSLKSGNKESITRKLGHSADMPYPKNWKMIDNLGQELYNRKERIKTKMRLAEANDFESSSLSTLPRGYFG